MATVALTVISLTGSNGTSFVVGLEVALETLTEEEVSFYFFGTADTTLRETFVKCFGRNSNPTQISSKVRRVLHST